MTKRVFEAAREYGVQTKTVIQALAEHNIKASNFMGVDASMQVILDKKFKGAGSAEAAPSKPAEKRQPEKAQQRPAGRDGQSKGQAAKKDRPQHGGRQQAGQQQSGQQKQNRRPAGDGGSSRQSDRAAQQQDRNRRHDGRADNRGGRPNGQQRQNGGNRSNRSERNNSDRNGADRSGQQRQNGQGGQSGQGSTAKRTKYFNRPQKGDNKRNKNDRSNKGGNKQANRPHTLLSNVLNKGKNKNNRRNDHRGHNSNDPHGQQTKKKNYPEAVTLPETLSVKDFAERLGREVGEVIKRLLLGGIMATINQEIDYDTAALIADEFGVTVSMEAPPEDPTEIEEIADAPETLKHRPPVVTIMGHVDHGKTSLLDAIRKTNVTGQEAGGITQHIGAYQVRYEGKRITFMDTPGHEAFTAMRARGAQVTDIAVLVVAADDGVMPQTIESINHAKSAGVPVIVAINKIDKEGANPNNVMQQLTEYGLISEDWGGDTIMVPVSAHTKQGLDDLLENILVLAEVSDFKANPDRPAQGVVIEAKLDKGRGPVASVLVQKGTLRVGDSILVGNCYGKIRAMNNERGERVKKAEPSLPVEILGLNDVPEAGDILNVTDEKTARFVAEKRLEKKRSSELHVNTKVTLDDLFSQIQQGELKELSLIVKGDVQGSVEALSQSLLAIKSDEVRISIVHAGVGAITESDIMLASASNALIIGFNVRPDLSARKAAEKETVDMRTYRVIYDAINDVEAAIKGMLDKKYEEHIIGRAEVRKVITTPKVIVGGSYVREGKITSTSKIRLIRNGIVVHEGELDGLRRFKDDVKEVAEGYECGITIEGYRDIKEGDEVEAYEMVEVAPE
ncbi:translation initiation factor IF-2 [Megasphaera coli]|uniref:translation initiation factor IF-2 n=1 Tax=Colibacter massiliensis TaxID=1852379 RepID=UPI00094EFA5D|nr:translation initiation factor IF-2 [Colibacter massiliensis]